jgi:hypothetical protein
MWIWKCRRLHYSIISLFLIFLCYCLIRLFQVHKVDSMVAYREADEWEL